MNILTYMQRQESEGFQSLHNKAFTLAEVLITLGIIGVVAAMTIPILQKIQVIEYKSAYKKSYSTFYQAYTKIQNEECGGTLANCFPGSGDTPSEAFNDALARHLKIIKKCSGTATYGGSGPGVGPGGCFHNGSAIKTFYGATGPWDGQTFYYPGLVLADGSMIYIRYFSDTCTNTPGGGSYSNRCATITWDSNGFKPPNATGKDIMLINVTADKLIPFGLFGVVMNECPPAGENVSSTDLAAGQSCGPYYLQN